MLPDWWGTASIFGLVTWLPQERKILAVAPCSLDKDLNPPLLPAPSLLFFIYTSPAKMENAQSIKVLDDLLAKLSISTSQDEVNAATRNIATFINGPIEEQDAPTE